MEALRAVYSAVDSIADGEPGVSVRRQEIRNHLKKNRQYDFGEGGIRGYPQLLTQLAAFRDQDQGYSLAPEFSPQKFTDADLFRRFENHLRREGAMTTPPSGRVKRDLMKYYMYRESGGLGKERRWYTTFWKDYLDETARAGDSYDARLRKTDSYLSTQSERRELFQSVLDRFPFESSDLQGLPIDVLRRMNNTESFTEAQRIRIASGSGISRLDLERLTTDQRQPYSFPRDFELYPWQQEAADQWFTSGLDGSKEPETGITQVITGAGKTVMALSIIQRWIDENPDGVISVLVPTNVLMQQWLTELTGTLNVPVSDIGWAGGGHKDSFTEDCRIIVSIVNSAVKDDYLGQDLNQAGTPPHLLIADECHRYTGEVFSNVFDYHRTATLGLSATPLSQTVHEPAFTDQLVQSDDFTVADSDSLLLQELGPVYYTLTYQEGLDRGLIPEFEINYIGFELTAAERHTYDKLTRQIGDALSDIRSRYGNRLATMGGEFNQNLQLLLQQEDLSTPEIADYFEYTSDRQQVVADATRRQAITLTLLERVIENDEKAIVFQERIEQLERMVAPFDRRGRDVRTDEVTDADYRTALYEQYPKLQQVDQEFEQLLSRAAYKPVMYHSGHSRPIWNDFAIRWFREGGFANVMLSVKALIEGVDVPSADIGIIRVSSSSVRQRIQTLGRVLRTGEDPDEKSELYVLYARDTVDEKIFSKHDWRDELANADVGHYIWEPDDSDQALSGRMREATDDELPDSGKYSPATVPDASELEVGDEYSGPQDGYRISVDSEGIPFEPGKNSRREITNPELQSAATFVHNLKDGGEIIINNAGHLLTRSPDGDILFVGTFDGDVDEIEYGEQTGRLSGDAPTDVDELLD
ncbi:DEAD/DEAH box helicase [Halobellus ruber]|uniref:DEAD/DEAH box helicase family protein n=1 Tax=Halobellus ruber TaxID=2761102 RepID=A0A7J9SGD8_9EURY|nr:DEAD/DEAH box helicase family protein [Halobellus ruber]MBB6645056.1 DEAD/DEAH box helicase family protein [Halobellus ruber]